MRTFPANDVAFEIETIYMSRRSIAQLLKSLDGVTDVELVGHLGSRSDVRLKFNFHQVKYLVIEPFGDNSRYWIGPENTKDGIRTKQLENTFKSYRPPFIRSVIGDVLHLRLFNRGRD